MSDDDDGDDDDGGGSGDCEDEMTVDAHAFLSRQPPNGQPQNEKAEGFKASRHDDGCRRSG